MDATATIQNRVTASDAIAPRRFLTAADLELEFGDVVEGLELGFAPARSAGAGKASAPGIARLFSVFG